MLDDKDNLYDNKHKKSKFRLSLLLHDPITGLLPNRNCLDFDVYRGLHHDDSAFVAITNNTFYVKTDKNFNMFYLDIILSKVFVGEFIYIIDINNNLYHTYLSVDGIKPLKLFNENIRDVIDIYFSNNIVYINTNSGLYISNNNMITKFLSPDKQLLTMSFYITKLRNHSVNREFMIFQDDLIYFTRGFVTSEYLLGFDKKIKKILYLNLIIF